MSELPQFHLLFVIFGEDGCTGKPSGPSNHLLRCFMIVLLFLVPYFPYECPCAHNKFATFSLSMNHVPSHCWSHKLLYSVCSDQTTEVKPEEMVRNLRSWDMKLCSHLWTKNLYHSSFRKKAGGFPEQHQTEISCADYHQLLVQGELPSSRGGSKATMSAHQQWYLVDNCLCDNYIGMVMCFGHEIRPCDMLCVLMVVEWISPSLISVFRIEG